MASLGTRKLGAVSSPQQQPASGASPTQIAGQQSAPATAVPGTPGLQGYTPSRSQTNSMAVVSLITGAVSVFGHLVLPGIGGGTLALIAIVTGVIARGEIKRSGEQGMWMATVGILLGILHLLVIALIFIFLIGAIFVIGGWALLHH
ncbi:MAG: DUF4190 domain-containing protein [Chloroflexi bacterium]|nr:MAG: DUF4190 domain-containing protein [Chloroflexota bacterium]TME40858.1 MAG: DUF4190 domain-containing protein [Chloroflexota bacterium]